MLFGRRNFYRESTVQCTSCQDGIRLSGIQLMCVLLGEGVISSYCSSNNMVSIKTILYLDDVAHSPLWLCPSDVYASRIPIHTHRHIHSPHPNLWQRNLFCGRNEWLRYIYIQCVVSMELAGVRQHCTVQHAHELIANAKINEIDGQMSASAIAATATDEHFQILLFRRRSCNSTDSKLKQSRRINSMLALCVRCVWTRVCVCVIWHASVVNCMVELCPAVRQRTEIPWHFNWSYWNKFVGTEEIHRQSNIHFIVCHERWWVNLLVSIRQSLFGISLK